MLERKWNYGGLKELIKNEQDKSIEEFLINLTPTEATNYSLGKLTRKIKRTPQKTIPPIKQENGEWARTNKDKTRVFADHLKKVFEPVASASPE